MKSEILISNTGHPLPGPILITPQVFGDERGFFMESWNQRVWKDILLKNDQDECTFVQDNHSRSSLGVLRGLHYQVAPSSQGKLVRCLYGKIFDVAIDIRASSPTKGQWVGVFLDNKEMRQLWIPSGFAHGFLTLTEHAEVLYKTTDFWNPNAERSIRWDDPFLDIKWPTHDCLGNLLQVNLSEKDRLAVLFSNLNSSELLD